MGVLLVFMNRFLNFFFVLVFFFFDLYCMCLLYLVIKMMMLLDMLYWKFISSKKVGMKYVEMKMSVNSYFWVFFFFLYCCMVLFLFFVSSFMLVLVIVVVVFLFFIKMVWFMKWMYFGLLELGLEKFEYDFGFDMGKLLFLDVVGVWFVVGLFEVFYSLMKFVML